MYAVDFRARARAALSGNWGSAIGVTFVATLLGAGGGGVVAATSYNSGNLENLMHTMSPELMHFFIVLGSILAVYALVIFLIGGVMRVGLCHYHTLLVAGQEQRPFDTLFAPFRYWFKAFGLCFMMGLFTVLWTLLLIVPGIIAAYRYSMAPYLLAQNPELGVFEAIDQSKKLMNGHKWRLFCLHFSFIGWYFLAVLTQGIAGLWVVPYSCAAEAAFFLDLTDQLDAQPDEAPVLDEPLIAE